MDVSLEELQRAVDVFRILNNLNNPLDMEKWLKDKKLTLEILEDYLETNLIISKFKETLENKVVYENYLSSFAINSLSEFPS